jgi:16S rRNA processing protein RimM
LLKRFRKSSLAASDDFRNLGHKECVLESFTGQSPDIAEGYIAIGHIAAVFGVKGEVKVTLATDFPERFQGLETVYLGPEARPVRLLSSRPHQGNVLARLEGYNDRDSAQTLQGLWIQVPRADILPLGEGEHYVFQLIGLRVRTTDGRELGVIDEILSTPANEVFVVRGDAGEVLIPYINDVIAEERLDAGEIIVHPVPGLLD